LTPCERCGKPVSGVMFCYDCAPEEDLMALLDKLASGEGGRRTGELKRRGFLRWEVTPEGLAALAAWKGPK